MIWLPKSFGRNIFFGAAFSFWATYCHEKVTKSCLTRFFHEFFLEYSCNIEQLVRQLFCSQSFFWYAHVKFGATFHSNCTNCPKSESWLGLSRKLLIHSRVVVEEIKREMDFKEMDLREMSNDNTGSTQRQHAVGCTKVSKQIVTCHDLTGCTHDLNLRGLYKYKWEVYVMNSHY